MSGLRCSNCQTDNSLDRNFCENCGIQLQKKAIIIRPDNGIKVVGRQIPARQLKRIGASIVVSAAALLAEVGYLYLRKRLNQNGNGFRLVPRSSQDNKEKNLQNTESRLLSGKRVVSIYQEQVVEELRWGRPVRRIIRRMSWRSEENVET